MELLKAEVKCAERAASRAIRRRAANREALYAEYCRLSTLLSFRRHIRAGFARKAREATVVRERRERLAREAAEARVSLVPRTHEVPEGRSDTLKL
jgi:hypothetical protein